MKKFSRLTILVGIMFFMTIVSYADEKLKHLRENAGNGDASAQFNLGNMYYNGKGVQRDYKKAAKWLRMAAEQGVAGSQMILGIMYFNGEGVTQDYKEAAKWYRKAANQGHADAQNNLGKMYANGKGVAQNHVKAYAWINLSAEQNPKYADIIDILFTLMTPQQIASAQELSIKLHKMIETNAKQNKSKPYQNLTLH
jgi:TPR repeat protein